MRYRLKFLAVLINIFLFSSVFISSLYQPLDPDLGWHLKYGEYFFQNGTILRDNIFSQLMPDYKWANSSWLTDLITYQTFNNFGFWGLSILSAFTIVGIFFFLGKAAKLDFFEKILIFPLLLYFEASVIKVSFRGQLLSLLLISIMFYLLSKYEKQKKIVILIVPLFTLWSNLHGEFILGFALFFIWVFVYLLKEQLLVYKKNVKRMIEKNLLLIIAFFGAFLASLINPFGINIYFETIKHFGDPMQKTITEWQSITDFSSVWWHQIFISIIGGIGIILAGLNRKSMGKLPFYVPSMILFILTFGVRRYAWPFYYSTIFMLKPVADFFKPESEKNKYIVSFVLVLLFLSLSIFLKFPFSNLRNMNWNTYCKRSISCSPTAAQTVIHHKLNDDKLLTIYDFGGWLIWNYPSIKPTVDGRMHLWRDENNFSGFEWFHPIEQNTTGDIQNSKFNAVLTSNRKPIYYRLLQLQKERKWEAIHIDKYSAVFVRISPEN